MDESIVLLSSMSPKIKHKRCRKGISLLAMKSNIRKSSVHKPPPKNYNDVSLVEEATESSSSYVSEKPIVVNDEPIVISDTSESGGSMKGSLEPAVPSANGAYLQDSPEPDKEDFIKKWIEDVAIETTFNDGSVLMEMSTIHGIDNEFLPKEKGNAVNSTFAKGTEKRFDELFKNKQEVENFETCVRDMSKSFMEALVDNDSFETRNSMRIAGKNSNLTNDSDAKLIISDSFEHEKNEMRNDKATNNSILTNDESDLSYKLLAKSDDTKMIRSSILTNDDSSSSVHNNIKGKVSCNSILTNDESNSAYNKPIDDCDQRLSIQSEGKQKRSVNSLNKENEPPVKNSPCTPQTNFKQISYSDLNNRKQGNENELSSDISSGDESDIENENNLKDAEKVLDALYGNSWREKQELILPKTEPRKNKVRPAAEKLAHSERRNPKKSLIYKNPYLDFDSVQKNPSRVQIEKHVSPSPLIEKLKKLCDSDTTSDEDQKHLHKQKLNFDDIPDGRTSKYFVKNQENSVKTPEHADEFDMPDFGKSLEERIKKKMNNIHIGDKLKIKAVNHRKNRLKESEKEDSKVNSKLNPLKAINGIGMINSEKNTSDNRQNSKTSSEIMLEVTKSIIRNKKILQSDETSGPGSTDRKKVQSKDKKVNQNYETSSSSSETSGDNDKRVQKDNRRQLNIDHSGKIYKTAGKPSRSRSSPESDTNKSKIDDKIDSGKNIKKMLKSRKSSTSSSEPDTNPKIIRGVKKDKPTGDSETNFDGSNKITNKKNSNIFLNDSGESDDSSDEFDERVKRIHRSSFAHGKYSFLESLSGSIPLYTCDFKARMYRNNYKNMRDDLAAELFKLYNKKIFDNKIPQDTPLKWNDRMRGTAGYCYCRKITRSNGDTERLVRIELATKVLDSADRLRDTLVHEMCHAAAWIINCVSDGHGSYWKSWAYKAMSTFPELPPIKRCHDYVLNTKYTYKCTGCGYSIGRHTKSLDIERKRCGHCYGKFEVLINKVSKKGESKSVPATPKKQATGFALFVKENYGGYKTPDRQHGDVMKILGQKFQEIKVKK